LVNLTIDGKLLSSTVGSLRASGAYSDSDTSPAGFVSDLAYAWNTKYATSGSASDTMSLFSVDGDTASSVLAISAKSGSGSRGYDKAYSISITAASATLGSATFGAYYGATTDASDNKTISNGIIITIESDDAGTVLDRTSAMAFTDGSGAVLTSSTGITEILHTQLRAVAETGTTTTDNIYPRDARGDVVVAEGGVDEVATAATAFDRTSWLD